jgi:hypothetical protein
MFERFSINQGNTIFYKFALHFEFLFERGGRGAIATLCARAVAKPKDLA